MDAGIAGILGAIAGAAGATATAAIAGFYGLAQARLEVRAEHERIVRETRRGAYANLAEALSKANDALQESEYTARACRQIDQAHRRELIESSMEKLLEADTPYGALSAHQALVSVEGPPPIRLAASNATNSTAQYRLSITKLQTALQKSEPFEGAVAAALKNRLAAIEAAYKFETIAADELAKITERAVA
ncbi:hypothetical protein [Streptomyces sp. NPDC047042]|uniref:hypothetical protein n=1 Tax=Streptomyces sp. NPDC047042 TaxID=3154807 RepID=UPI0033F41B89